MKEKLSDKIKQIFIINIVTQTFFSIEFDFLNRNNNNIAIIISINGIKKNIISYHL